MLNDRSVIKRLSVMHKICLPSDNFAGIANLLRIYIALAVATIAVLLVLALVNPHNAPHNAWAHALIVAGFAALLPMRLRSARRGSVGALRAVGLIAATLSLVNVVEALLPGFVPVWMRWEMFGIAALMLGVIAFVVREASEGR